MRRFSLLFAAGVLVALASIQARASTTVVSKPGSGAWDHYLAAHLLRRAGFGGDFGDIIKLYELGKERAVDYLVDFDKISQTDPDYPLPPPGKLPGGFGTTEDDKRISRDIFRMINENHMKGVREWWLRRMTVSERPLEEKMTLFWHGHFCTGFQEVERWDYLYKQNQMFRKMGMGNFRDLLLAVAKDPAMLIYLDGRTNTKGHPNENFGRELLELFTMGEGNKYREKDVLEGARALSGWIVNDKEEGEFVKDRWDEGVKEYLGEKGNFGLEQVVDTILKQPECPRFLARKLLAFFVIRSPDDSMIDDVAAQIRAKNYEMREVLRYIFKADFFFRPDVIAAQIKSPVEMVVGTYRSLEIDPVDPHAMYKDCRIMGQDLFQPPDVAGWEGGHGWINSSTLFRRYNFAARLLGPTPTPGKEKGGTTKMMEKPSSEGFQNAVEKKMEELSAPVKEKVKDALAKYSMPLTYSAELQAFDPLPICAKYKLESAVDVIKHFQLRLLASNPDPNKSMVLLNMLNGTSNNFSTHGKDAGQKVRYLIHLLMSTPEFNLE